jgi:selenocysteine-specific elongation factor
MLAVAGVVDLAQFALIRNLSSAQAAALAEVGAEEFRVVGPEGAAVAVIHKYLAALADQITAALARWHQAQPDMLGPTRPALLAHFRGTPPAAFDAALAELAGRGQAVREGGMWRLPQHRPRLANADEKLWARMRPLLAAGELRPPRVREIAQDLALEPEAVERLLHRAERLGRVAKIAANRFFLPETVDRLAAIAGELAAAAPESGFTAAMFNERAGVGRNLTIQILEYLDKTGATRRTGETRVVLAIGAAFG